MGIDSQLERAVEKLLGLKNNFEDFRVLLTSNDIQN